MSSCARLASGVAALFMLLLANSAFGVGVGWGDSAAFVLDTTGVTSGTGGVGWDDSGAFTLDTTGVTSGTGGVGWDDSGTFTLNTTGVTSGTGGVDWDDSGTFTLNTTGVTFGTGGVGWADSGGFVFNTTGITALGGVGWADSGSFVLNTLNAIDIGLRVFDGQSIIAIACEPANSLTSPMRINKHGQSYGILLVSTNEANASRIRIQTSAGTKAWQKY